VLDATGFTVTTTGTNADSTVTITTRKSKSVGDDGRATLLGVTVGGASSADSLKSFTAATSDLRGQLLIGGSVGTLNLGNLYGDAAIKILDNASSNLLLTTLQLKAVTDGSIESAQAIKTLKVAGWSDRTGAADQITAPSIGTVTSTGDFNANLNLTSGVALSKLSATGVINGAVLNVAGGIGTLRAAAVRSSTITAPSLQSLTIKGDFNADVSLTDASALSAKTITIGGVVGDSTFRLAGDAGTVSFGAMRDSAFYVGVNGSPTALPSAGQLNTSKSMKSLTIKGLKTEAHAFVNSFIAAASITKLALVNVDIDNGGAPFGVVADQVGSYSRNGATLRNLIQASEPDAIADFVMRIV